MKLIMLFIDSGNSEIIPASSRIVFWYMFILSWGLLGSSFAILVHCPSMRWSCRWVQTIKPHSLRKESGRPYMDGERKQGRGGSTGAALMIQVFNNPYETSTVCSVEHEELLMDLLLTLT